MQVYVQACAGLCRPQACYCPLDQGKSCGSVQSLCWRSRYRELKYWAIAAGRLPQIRTLCQSLSRPCVVLQMLVTSAFAPSWLDALVIMSKLLLAG